MKNKRSWKENLRLVNIAAKPASLHLQEVGYCVIEVIWKNKKAEQRTVCRVNVPFRQTTDTLK
jgi:hypothetical protein